MGGGRQNNKVTTKRRWLREVFVRAATVLALEARYHGSGYCAAPQQVVTVVDLTERDALGD